MPTLSRTRAACRLALATTLALFSAACADDLPTTRATPPPGETVRASIVCTVTVATGQARCDDTPAGGGSRNILLGGQGTYVRLEASNHAYDSVAALYAIDVTVQNLLAQQMGTPDGTTVTGVKVFFERLPSATDGAGEVTVANPDGRGVFTGADQPYFDYAQILEARGGSQPRTWRFNLPKSVEAFSFGVYVETQLPAEQGVLRWRSEHGAAYSAAPFSQTLYAVWAGGVNDIFVTGNTEIYHWDGNEWTAFPLPRRANVARIFDLAGSSRTQLYGVGENSAVWRYDGNRWTQVYSSGLDRGYSGRQEGVWARGDTVVTAGHGSAWNDDAWGGQIMVSTNAGKDFTRTLSTGPAMTREFWDVSGTSTADLWVVGFDERTDTERTRAVVLHSTDAGATWDEQIHGDEGHRYYGGVWAEPGRVIVGGGHINISTGRWEALLMESTDGGETWNETWFAVPGKNRYVREVWGTPGGTLHAVGSDGSTFINTGSGWRDVTGAATASLTGLHGTGGEAWAVGVYGAVVRYRGGAWSAVDLQATATGTLRSVWGSSATDVYAVGHRPGPNAAEQSVLMHNDGTTWSTVLPAADSTEYADVWGSGASDVYVVGHRLNAGGDATGMIWHYDGGGWTATPLAGTDRRLTTVWGSGPGDVWALGRQTGASGDEVVILHSTDGGQSWSTSAVSGVPAGEAHVLDAWGSGPGNVYAVGYAIPTGATVASSMVLRYNGSAWTATTEEDRVRLSGVWGAGAGDVHVVGYDLVEYAPDEAVGIIRRSTDGGASWTTLRFDGAPTAFANRRLLGVWGTSAGDVYAVGAGPILHFDGVQWREQGSYGWPMFRAVWGSSATNVFAVGEKNAIVHGIR